MTTEDRPGANPWLGLRARNGSFVHRDDWPYVEAFNSNVLSDKHRLVTSARPQPWAGPIDSARVLILGANPGWSSGDAEAEERLAPLLRENLRGDRPMFWMDPGAANTPGERWVRGKLLRRILQELETTMGHQTAEEVVAGSVAVVEFHAYHSPSWKPLPVTLPSQWYTFERVRERIADGAMVIITRAAREWKVAVPQLGAHRNLFPTRSAQNVQLSPANIGHEGWHQLTERLYAAHRIWFGG